MPEFDRDGRVVSQFWLQGGKHNATPTDKRTRPSRAPLMSSGPPPPLGRMEGTLRFPETAKNMRESNLARRKRSQ